MTHEDISSSSEIQVLLLNSIVTDNEGSYSLVCKSRFESSLTVKCRIFLISPRPCPHPQWVVTVANDCGKIHAALTLARVTRIGQGRADGAQNRTEQTFIRLPREQPSELRASEITARSDSLYTMGIKGPPSLPVAFVNRAGMAEGWNVFDIVGRRAEEKGRGEIGEEIQFDGTVCPSDLLCV